MTLTLELSAELESRLTEAAARQGLPVERFTLSLLESRLTSVGRASEFRELIDGWLVRGDEDEQKATGEFLIQSLDEDRPSERSLFPADKKGKTW